MKAPSFSNRDVCELCKTLTHVSSNGICESCLKELSAAKKTPELRDQRLKKLEGIENALIRFTGKIIAHQTRQIEGRFPSRLERQGKQIERAELRKARDILSATPQELTSQRPAETLNIQISALNNEFFTYLSRHPELVHQLTPRRFEELVAEILRDMGCSVEITPCTRDKGRDILATFKTPTGEMLTIVECKKYHPRNKIGIDIVERFLWTIGRDKASCGIIATTSHFSSEAAKYANEFKYRLKLKDFEGLREWIGNYGKWMCVEGSRIWIPKV